ncbi:CaiB/BaiF CoA transferase family protein [Actinomarinicola tropica]|uniref:CaiB/BaiF CoA transferase family protein n=1 Tax=Actinomarinicola tropica TaxID=2789776 RepID=UPI001E46938C|nr:CoA transferase [Actinomarinicola tropica]
MTLPLDDIRVLDLTVARAGPTCVRQLADWGADVVRIEAPTHPGQPGVAGEDRHGSDVQYVHRNKRALSLDLRTDAGRAVLHDLVDTADVLVENMRPPVKGRLGFDWDTVHARNPRLVMASISGFGQDGPYAARGGVDQIAQGMGGLMSVTGEPGRGPMRVGIPVSDLASGLYAAVGVLAALHDRERTGRGRWVRTSLLESMIAMMDLQAARWTVDGVVPGQEGNHHPTLLPMGCFESADGHVNVAGPSGRLWRGFCTAIGREDLLTDPRFGTGAARHERRGELNGIIADVLRTRTTAEWVEVLTAHGVPAGPVNTMDQVFADPQVTHLEMVGEVVHPTLGALRLVRHPVRMSDDGGPAATVRTHAPDPGEHTDEILAALGRTADQIAALRRDGTI